jgi:cell division protein FtsB
MRILVIIGIVLLLLLQARLWFSDVGVVKRSALREQLELQHEQQARVAERNQALAAEVAAFRSEEGLKAVEARARSDLGMVKEGETFYLIVDP